MSDNRFQRASFIVTDLEQSLLFYRDVLALAVDVSEDLPPDAYSYTAFDIPRDRPLRRAVLSTASQARVLALTEVPRPLDAVPGPLRAGIVMDTGDIDGVVDGARGLGLHVYPEGRLTTHDGRAGREVGIVDRDDNLVVIQHIPASG